MPEKYLYEYAVIRIVPKVEREEFINCGILLFCKQQKFLSVKYLLNVEKVTLFSPEADLSELEQHLESFHKIVKGTRTGGRIAEMDMASRFRWLTAVRSSCIQTSRPHCGFSTDLEKTLDNLFQELVM